jgi:hypothetical protein
MRPIAAANPFFKYILLFVGSLTVVCLLGSILIAVIAPKDMTPAQQDVLSLCRYGFTSGLALFVGLAGGRAGHPDYFGHLPTTAGAPPASRQAPRPRQQRAQAGGTAAPTQGPPPPAPTSPPQTGPA